MIEPTAVILRPVPLNAEGRAGNGVYHGIGLPLWVADPNYGLSRFIRAPDQDTAMRRAKTMFRVPVTFDLNPRQDTVVVLRKQKEKDNGST